MTHIGSISELLAESSKKEEGFKSSERKPFGYVPPRLKMDEENF